jgi:hypothetical protein
MNLEEGRPFVRLGIRPFGAALDKRDANLLRKSFESFGKGYVVNQHDELENVSANTTAKTVKDLFAGMDRKRWGLFLMKRAKAHHVCTGFAQLNVVTYDLDNIGSGANVFNLIHGHSVITGSPASMAGGARLPQARCNHQLGQARGQTFHLRNHQQPLRRFLKFVGFELAAKKVKVSAALGTAVCARGP